MVQVDGTVVGAGVMEEEAKTLAQAVDVGQYLVGTVGTPQELQEVEVHSSKVAEDRVHWAMGE